MALSRLLRVLGKAGSISKGKVVHGRMITCGFLSNVYAGNNLMSMYVQCDRVDDARQLFDHMPEKNLVSWTILISGYSKVGRAEEALNSFRSMVSMGFSPNDFTYVSAISACASIGVARTGMEIHGRTYRVEHDSLNNFVSNSLVSFYAKCSMMNTAQRVFNRILHPNLVSWASILSGYCQCGENVEALRMFSQLWKEGVEVNEYVYASVLGACASLAEPRVGRQVHCHVIKSGFRSEMFIEAGIIDLYVKCGELVWASQAFLELDKPGLASWTALIGGYTQHGKGKKAMELFSELRSSGLKPNEHTFASVIASCSCTATIGGGKQLHSLIIKSGFKLVGYIGNAIVDLYAKSGLLEESNKVFKEMEERDIVSWNTLISGYIGQFSFRGAVELLKHMLLEGIHPNLYTYSSILSLCGDLPAVGWGKQTHCCVIKPAFDTNVVVGSALVDMYAKCGRLADAHNIFHKLTVKNLVSWNSMLVGYAQHGLAKEALDMFDMMEREGIKPNDITFIGVLSACGHAGLVKEGNCYFNSMTRNHAIIPKIDHFACMVDLFARDGQIRRAYEFIRGMPLEPDKVIWRSLLSGCKTHGEFDIGRYAAECILKIDPEDVSAHVMMSGVYANSEMLDEKAEVRKLMKGLKKVPGCSWIEVKNRIKYFIASDKVSNNQNCISDIVNRLAVQMMDVGYVPNTNFCEDSGE